MCVYVNIYIFCMYIDTYIYMAEDDLEMVEALAEIGIYICIFVTVCMCVCIMYLFTHTYIYIYIYIYIIDDMEDDEKGKALYMLLHKVAAGRQYNQYVDPASGWCHDNALFFQIIMLFRLGLYVYFPHVESRFCNSLPCCKF
jgi:hypothetical protein